MLCLSDASLNSCLGIASIVDLVYGSGVMPAQIIDLFCGVGGLTRGLLDSGLNVIAGYDIDETCQYAYEHNNHVVFHQQNVRALTAEALAAEYDNNAVRILVGCAPCQPFSQMRSKMGQANLLDEKYDLINEFGRLINEIRPVVISMENVPQLQRSNIFYDFLELLARLNYHVDSRVIYCPDYGISQSRRRIVLVGSLLGEIEIIPPTHDRNTVFVQDFIANLPEIAAGEICEDDFLHQSAHLSDINLQRIQASVPGGTWRDWPEELRCDCHRRETGRTYASVYGRMRWNQVGPTITTQFYCYGTGRYGHPEQDRALSLREGALLQTFPMNYDFINPDVPFSFKDIARHIGNAVPVRLGTVIGMTIINHLNMNGIEIN